jgi:DNA-3-methyladenine glycosylase
MNHTKPGQKLNKTFYQRSALKVAAELLGKIFVKRDGRKVLSGMIVEVEAYIGSIDQAAHSFRGKTKRNQVMFNKGGCLYVYFTYGNHFCCNVVTGKEEEGDAVLIRAVEPIDGIDRMMLNRFRKKSIGPKEKLSLTNGPGKICSAFEINSKHNGIDLTGNEIFILNNKKISESGIVTTTRIGIKKSTELLWRFYIKDNPFISKK